MSQHGGDPELRERPVGELLRELSNQTTTLVKQEIELAKAELREKGKTAGVGAGMFGGAGAFGLLTLGALSACLILALNHAIVDWLAALIVTVLWAAVTGALALAGRKKTQEAAPAVPEQTVETVKEDVQWAKTRAKSGRR